VPAGVPTAQTGQWVQGPGADFFEAVSGELGGLPFIVEDLGIITPDVRSLRDQFQLPGTRVLQFAFDGHTDNPYLPHNFVSNTVVYTGTHDNAPTREWYEELADYQRQNLWNYLRRVPGGDPDAAPALMDLASSSKAALAIAPLQDVLNLGPESRMNVPGRAVGNWRWRCREDMLSQATFEWLRNLTETSKRAGVWASTPEGSLGNESMSVAVSGP
jgi:4-alpha-glucanotransferase